MRFPGEIVLIVCVAWEFYSPTWTTHYFMALWTHDIIYLIFPLSVRGCASAHKNSLNSLLKIFMCNQIFLFIGSANVLVTLRLGKLIVLFFYWSFEGFYELVNQFNRDTTIYFFRILEIYHKLQIFIYNDDQTHQLSLKKLNFRRSIYARSLCVLLSVRLSSLKASIHSYEAIRTQSLIWHRNC